MKLGDKLCIRDCEIIAVQRYALDIDVITKVKTFSFRYQSREEVAVVYDKVCEMLEKKDV